jgi:hypothetical protein
MYYSIVYANLCKDVHFTCKVQLAANNIMDIFAVRYIFVLPFVSSMDEI